MTKMRKARKVPRVPRVYCTVRHYNRNTEELRPAVGRVDPDEDPEVTFDRAMQRLYELEEQIGQER